MTSRPRLETLLVHAGEPRPRIGGAASVPIFQSSVYECEGGGSYAAIPYPRLSNLPNHVALAGKLAALEGTEAALVSASGMAAISTALLAVLREGDHLLVQDCLYGGTHAFVHEELPRLGIECAALPDDPAAWGAAVQANTRAVYVEAMTNPLLQVIDHRAVVDLARRRQLVSVIDSTFATPVNFRPAALGYDLVVHSATKYLNGHSDLVAGAVAGPKALVDQVHVRLNHFGGSLDPHACYLLYRGLRTLALRVRYQNQSALRIAGFLRERPEVARVNYAGLPDHPGHALASELFAGCGGLLSFELAGGAAAAARFLGALTLPIQGPSLGGPETLVTRPARTSHLSLSAEERERLGIRDGLIRMSVGLEATDDVIEDLEQALAAVEAGR